jgi:hypothetical protein
LGLVSPLKSLSNHLRFSFKPFFLVPSSFNLFFLPPPPRFFFVFFLRRPLRFIINCNDSYRELRIQVPFALVLPYPKFQLQQQHLELQATSYLHNNPLHLERKSVHHLWIPILIHPRLFCRELEINHAFALACDCFSLAAAPRAKTDPNRRSRRQSFLGPPLTIIATSTNKLPKIPRYSSAAKTRPPLHQASVDICHRLCPDDTGLAPQCPPVPCVFYRIPLPLPPDYQSRNGASS